jgi:GNAT superfamily N-acetyltransferase
MASTSKLSDILIQELREEDLVEADRIVRLAFGTFLGIPDPMQMFGDREMIRNRWRTNPAGAFGAYLDGKLVGSNFVTKWGTFGWFGPLTVSPKLWDRGIAKKLMEPTMELFSKWKTTHEGLFTFAHSPKHVGLYQKFGFYPQFLTAIMAKKVGEKKNEIERAEYETFSTVGSDKGRRDILSECRELTNKIDDGLDVAGEIEAVQTLELGETIVVRDSSRLAGFAVCHIGPKTEAGSGNCYVKFAASVSKVKFRELLNACDNFASKSGNVESIEAGVNLARVEAYREMVFHGFKTEFQGVAMHRPAEDSGFNKPDLFVVDDWR